MKKLRIRWNSLFNNTVLLFTMFSPSCTAPALSHARRCAGCECSHLTYIRRPFSQPHSPKHPSRCHAGQQPRLVPERAACRARERALGRQAVCGLFAPAGRVRRRPLAAARRRECRLDAAFTFTAHSARALPRPQDSDVISYSMQYALLQRFERGETAERVPVID